jgi:hypothetical protein
MRRNNERERERERERNRIVRNAYGVLVGKPVIKDRLCGVVVRVSGNRSRGPRFDSRPYQIF